MSETPHCPHCGMADSVSVRDSPGYVYFCGRCTKVITVEDITDGPFIDMCKKSMFTHYKAAVERATFEFNPDCTCSWCMEISESDKEQVRQSLLNSV